ncbi:MAG: sodium:solute symporter family protein [Angelakisella sp.]
MAVWMILAVYFVAMAGIGVYGYRRSSSFTDFVVGSRKAGPWVSAFAYGTNYFSAVLFIGYAARSGWDFGLWAMLIGVGNAFFGTYLAWKLLAEKTREFTRREKIKTMPQLFEKRYGSPAMKIYCAIVLFIFMTPYSASVYSGLSYLCEMVLGLEYHFAMLAVAVVSGVYLVLGGYVASLSADFVQGIIMIFGVIAMVLCIGNAPDVGGFVNGLTAIAQREMLASPLSLICLVLLTSFGAWGMPQMLHKFFGIADGDAIKKGRTISTVFCAIISIGAYYVGSMSGMFFDSIPAGGSDVMIPQILVRTLPPVLLGVVLVLVLSASVSTLSGITLTSCSTFAVDLVGSVRSITKKQSLTLTRWLCVLFIAGSFLIASFRSPILTLMSFSWGAVAGSFLPPYLLGLYFKWMNRFGAWCGMVGGLAIELVLAAISGFSAGAAPVIGICAIAGSFALCICGSLVYNAVNKQVEDNTDVLAERT